MQQQRMNGERRNEAYSAGKPTHSSSHPYDFAWFGLLIYPIPLEAGMANGVMTDLTVEHGQARNTLSGNVATIYHRPQADH